MPHELALALCLMAIVEGLFLFAFPRAWQRLALDLANGPPKRVRVFGGIAIILGLIFLQAVR